MKEYLKYIKCGYEFEFLSEFNENKLKKLLKYHLDKQIVIPYSYDTFDKKNMQVHSSVDATDLIFKLENDHSGDDLKDGKIITMWELITGPMEYYESRIILIKMLDFIKKYGWTTSKASIHVNISINSPERYDSKYQLRNLNKLKLCLTLDEERIWKYFPNRKNNVYAKSIKNIHPINPFLQTEDIASINSYNYKTPNSKYYGVNFHKLEKNYIEFRYMGGENYENKSNKILELVEYFADVIFDVVSKPEFNNDDIEKLKFLLRKQKKNSDSFINYDVFKNNYPNIKILIDLKEDEQIVKTYYINNIRYKIYNLLTNCNMKKGIVNFDTDVSRLQIKDSHLKNCLSIDKIDFINCELNGYFENCLFYNCTVKSSHLENCDINYGNLIEGSKIKDSNIGFSNKLVKCYIENKEHQISGTLEDCIIRKGEPNKLSILKNSVVLNKTEMENKNI